MQKIGIRLGYNWGVCIEPHIHRSGLVTFKPQGCEFFETEEEASEPTSE